ISCNEPELPPENSTSSVHSIERRFDAQPHVLSEFFGRAAERRRNTETDFAVCHTTKEIFRSSRFGCERLRRSRQHCLLHLWDGLLPLHRVDRADPLFGGGGLLTPRNRR